MCISSVFVSVLLSVIQYYSDREWLCCALLLTYDNGTVEMSERPHFARNASPEPGWSVWPAGSLPTRTHWWWVPTDHFGGYCCCWCRHRRRLFHHRRWPGWRYWGMILRSARDSKSWPPWAWPSPLASPLGTGRDEGKIMIRNSVATKVTLVDIDAYRFGISSWRLWIQF